MYGVAQSLLLPSLMRFAIPEDSAPGLFPALDCSVSL